LKLLAAYSLGIEAGRCDADRVQPDPAHGRQRQAEGERRSRWPRPWTALAARGPSLSVSMVTEKSIRSRVITDAPTKVSQTTV
jgi:hypothetical protein